MNFTINTEAKTVTINEPLNLEDFNRVIEVVASLDPDHVKEYHFVAPSKTTYEYFYDPRVGQPIYQYLTHN